MATKSAKPSAIKRRNAVARNNLLQKGGVHERSKTAERQKQKQATRKLAAQCSALGRQFDQYVALAA